MAASAALIQVEYEQLERASNGFASSASSKEDIEQWRKGLNHSMSELPQHWKEK